MSVEPPRGIAVVDVGATNTKVMLFGADGIPRAQRKVASRHVEGPPYRHIDPEPVFDLLRTALPELDRVLPVDVIVPCAHGAALACLTTGGDLALPVMDYTAEPPAALVEEYRRISPPFDEVFAPVLPMALTHALQLHWQERAFPEEFARIATILPWIQYATFRLTGERMSEISGLSSQSHLIAVRTNEYSSMARARGWDRLFAPIRKAWEVAGPVLPEFRGSRFRGRGVVLTGVHDSNANYLRYLAAGLNRFTLLSTGTWIIGFDTTTPVDKLVKERDTATNTDVFGRPVASCRFYGGREFELVAEGAAAELATLDDVRKLVAGDIHALPSFTDSGGPMPGTGGHGRIEGRKPETPAGRASLASLYCAQMTAESLDAVGSRSDIIVDGPFSENSCFVRVLARLRPNQRVFTSALREGTMAGAACLALMPGGRLPRVALALEEAHPAEIEGFDRYSRKWRDLAGAAPRKFMQN